MLLPCFIFLLIFFFSLVFKGLRFPSFSAMSVSSNVQDYRSSGSHAVQFTLNSVLFSHCGCLLSSSVGFTHSTVMRLRSEYGNRTSISFSSWIELATTRLSLTSQVARHIFDVFFAVSGGCIQAMPSFARNQAGNLRDSVENFRQDTNRSLLQQMGTAINGLTWDKASSSRLVSMPGLTMFLSIQLFLLKNLLASGGDSLTGSGSANEGKQMDYLKTNLHDYIAAIAISCPEKVTPCDISDLEFVLRQYIDRKETLVGSGEDYFPWPREGENVMSVALLSQFVRNRMFLPTLLKAKGVEDERNISVSDLTDSIYLLPHLPNLDLSLTYLSATCDISRCTRSSIYMPCPLPSTRLDTLKDCTVVLGPVVGVLLIENCTNCNITALCGTVVISSCENLQVHICCNTPPVLGVNLQKVFMAPYNSFYAMMSYDCQEIGINPLLNLWDVWVPEGMLLPPEKYVPVCFLVSPNVSKEWAVRGGSPTIANICKIPPKYENAVKNRLQNFQNTSNCIRGTYKILQDQGYQEEANLLRSKIHSMFISWINENGQGKALSELLHQP